jgi:hypothetical protein
MTSLMTTTTASATSPFLDVLTSSTAHTPDPPFALSVGAWQITQEDLPIYVGSAAGFLCLIVLLLAVTVWRCRVAPTPAGGGRDVERKDKRDDGEIIQITGFRRQLAFT